MVSRKRRWWCEREIVGEDDDVNNIISDEELLNLEEEIQIYEDNPNWENDALLPPVDTEDEQVEDDPQEIQPPSLRDIQIA